MFVLILMAVVILFFGATFLSSWLVVRPVLFLFYWVFCAWLTLTALLLALFDMRDICARARDAKRRLRSEAFGKEGGD